MIVLIYLLFTYSFSTLFACEISLPERFSVSTSPHYGEFFHYSGHGDEDENKFVRIHHCEKTASSKKFLMIAFGPQNIEFTDRSSVFDFSNQYRDSGCYIENNPFSVARTFLDRKKTLEERWQTIKACYRIEIIEEGTSTLEVPSPQPGCQVSVMSSKHMSFNGGFCFIKPKMDNKLRIGLSLREDCKSYQGLNELKALSVDFLSTLNFYIAGDSTGTSVDLNAIGSVPMRISVAPNNKILPLSDDFGTFSPQFPSLFKLPDTYPGSPDIEMISALKLKIRPTLWVNNNCQKRCSGEDCQSLCDFAQPIAAKIELIELHEGKESIHLATWYDGGIVQPNFQGEISGIGSEIDRTLINESSTYLLKMTFSDPKFDFEQFKSEFVSRTGSLGQIPRLSRGHSIPQIPSHPDITETAKVPYLPVIGDLNFSQSLSNGFTQSVKKFNNLFNYRAWPPFYDQVCNNQQCSSIGKDYLELTVKFKIKGEDSENQRLRTEIIHFSRKSNFLENFQRMKPKLTSIKCSF